MYHYQRPSVPAQAEPFIAGVRRFEFDSGLAPYNLHAFHQWQALSRHISKDVISKLAPLPSGNISITAEADPASLKPVTPAEKKLYAQLQESHAAATSSGGVLSSSSDYQHVISRLAMVPILAFTFAAASLSQNFPQYDCINHQVALLTRRSVQVGQPCRWTVSNNQDLQPQTDNRTLLICTAQT